MLLRKKQFPIIGAWRRNPMKYACLFLSCLVMPALVNAAPPAFPGAEGFGVTATGGRGGQVIYVTNLNASGPGSFQAALETPGKRYILFKVSGVIPALAHLRYGECTIAGQTSPGGIYVRGFLADDEPDWDTPPRHDNWILRFVHSRPEWYYNPPKNWGDACDDALRILQTREAIVDHCSLGRADDECVQISEASYITIQNCIIAETPGNHSEYGGMLLNYYSEQHPLDSVSIHHNIWNRIRGRVPELSRESPDAVNKTLMIELSCNVIWDNDFMIWGSSDTNVGTDPPKPIYYKMNWVNNLMYPRSSFTSGMFTDAIVRDAKSAPKNQLFVSGNKLNRFPQYSDYDLFYCCNDFDQYGPSPYPVLAEKMTKRHPFPTVTYTQTDQLLDYMVANVGCFPRDPMDKRLMKPVRKRKIDPRSTSNPKKQVNDAFKPYTRNPPTFPTDTDSDGMPDRWETSHSLNLNVQDHNGTALSTEGYTNLEVYLNELATQKISGAN